MHQDQQNPLLKLNKANVLLDAMDAAARAHHEARQIAKRSSPRVRRGFPDARLLYRLICAGSTAFGAMAMFWFLV